MFIVRKAMFIVQKNTRPSFRVADDEAIFFETKNCLNSKFFYFLFSCLFFSYKRFPKCYWAPVYDNNFGRPSFSAYFFFGSNFLILNMVRTLEIIIFQCKLNQDIYRNKLSTNFLRIVNSDYTSSSEELLETDNPVLVHHRNIQVLATELCKTEKRGSPEKMKGVFPFNGNATYNTRNTKMFHSGAIKSVTFSSENLVQHLKFRSLLQLKLRMQNWLPVLKELSKNGNQ